LDISGTPGRTSAAERAHDSGFSYVNRVVNAVETRRNLRSSEQSVRRSIDHEGNTMNRSLLSMFSLAAGAFLAGGCTADTTGTSEVKVHVNEKGDVINDETGEKINPDCAAMYMQGLDTANVCCW
jgi:hypothetical protein